MPGTGLTKNSGISGNSGITGHAYFLTAGDSHPVYTAYCRLLTQEDRINHPVEKVHVFSVFIGLSRIVFCILLSIAPGTEGFVPNSSKYNRYHTPIQRSILKPSDNSLHHLSRV